MIKLKNLVKSYITEDIKTTAINDINLEINSGDFVSIMGPSGCGKSTLLSILGMLDSPCQGEYLFNDKNLANLKESQLSDIRKANLGFVFQSFNLIDELTVFENVALPLMYNNADKALQKERVNALLERFDIAHRANHLPQQLSGGQQQRVAIARALATNPKLILADEPTGNLDSKNGAEVMKLLSELNREGTTIIMVTHSEQDAQYGNKIIKLLDGKIHHNRPIEVLEVECA
ncbi:MULTISPECIES: ABC transporter ATP-binding protein [Pseudoalteromonas]|uniref:ABC transporter ATP-binding protein n=2 Tax=Pseudoalteromonas TaxID=53246 RepID=UPI000FFE55A4|nr:MULTISPECIES: ABC transporter ATP-binding protein [Pseudoalteromonas]NKC20413.1 ATP-binding cassette domain-containing protein [Pseudoalteromonas galatheae]RXE86194.1 ABC transporter ATP-binding protein [Pseudoalteromonas sp. A757]